jgi:hypothetical protein
MIAVLDIFALAPDFKSAVFAIHDATTPVALVICFAGLVMCVQRALQERSVGAILPALIQISIVSLIIGSMPAIGNLIEQAVVDIETTAGVGNVSAFTQYTQVIKTKYGVDISALNNLVPNNGPVGPSNGSMLTSYGQANDPNSDPASAQGIGAFAPFLQAGSLISYQNPNTPASAALSPDEEAKYNVAPGQAFTVTTSTGQTLNLIFSDRTRSDLTGRIDIYDPHDNLTAANGLGSSVSNFTLGAPMSNAPGGQNPIQALGSWANSLLHPAESVQAGVFGMIVLVLSYIALALEWLAALIQSVLYYSEIAVAGLFVGFLLVPGLQTIAKGFLLSFVAIALAPIAFMIVGLLTKLIISIGLNAGNNPALGAANIAGLSYFWLIVLAIVAGTGSILGPWMLGKQIIRGASGMADLLVGSVSAARGVFSTAGKAGGAVVSGGAGAAASGGSRRFP